MKGTYTPEFTPVARPGQLLEIDDGADREVVEIDRYAPLPSITTDSFDLPAGEQTQVEVEALHTDGGFIAQYRPINLTQELPAGVSFTISQRSKQDNLYTNQAETSAIDAEAAYERVDAGGDTEIRPLTHLLEIYQLEDDELYFEFVNATGSDETVSLTFGGFNFDVSPSSSASQTPVYVPTAAVRGGTNTRA